MKNVSPICSEFCDICDAYRLSCSVLADKGGVLETGEEEGRPAAEIGENVDFVEKRIVRGTP